MCLLLLFSPLFAPSQFPISDSWLEGCFLVRGGLVTVQLTETLAKFNEAVIGTHVI
jgi:hypothetical protein